MPQAFTGILDFHTTANTHGLDQNCYYCAVAALCGMTVEEFFHRSEIMQQDTATPDEILALWKEGGVGNVAYAVLNHDNQLLPVVQTMPVNCGVGLAYTRANGTGHMVVLAKDAHQVVRCIDYQQNPPAVAAFPPEAGIVAVHIFYKTP